MPKDKIVAVSMVKDEADIIEYTIKHMDALGVGQFIIIDNGSTDGTREILEGMSESFPIEVRHEPDPAYYQSKRITQLYEDAGKYDATWVMPFDADELWSPESKQHTSYRSALKMLKYMVGEASCHRFCANTLSGDSPEEGNPFIRMRWMVINAGDIPKIVIRYIPKLGWTIKQGNHGVLDAAGVPVKARPSGLQVNHYPYRSFDQFVKKVINGGRAYELTNLPESAGAHWRAWYSAFKACGESALAEIYDGLYSGKKMVEVEGVYLGD